jgi:hypothetical protein
MLRSVALNHAVLAPPPVAILFLMVTPGMWYDQLRLAGDFSPQRGIIGRESRAFSSKLVDSRILERHKRCSYKVDGCHLETVRFSAVG